MAGYVSQPANQPHQEQALTALLDHIRRERGLECNQYKDSFFRRRLAVRMKVQDVDTYQAYLNLLRNDPAELDALLDALSINVSYFFRDAPVFDALRQAVLAPLLEERARIGQRSLRVWSAGCACGEEPYSVAMILKDLLKGKLSNWNVLIHATDVDASALVRAQQGVYRATSMRDLQADYVGRNFSQDGGTFVVRPEIRRMATFRQHDLTTRPPLAGYDLILCRNVLIYFARQHQGSVVRHLAEHLNPGGYLVLGMAETLPMSIVLAGCVEAVDGRLRIYRKHR